MAMKNPDPRSFNPSERARAHLDSLVDENDLGSVEGMTVLDNSFVRERVADPANVSLPEETLQVEDETPEVFAKEARTGTHYIHDVSNRNTIRLLILTSDETILDKKSIAGKRLVSFGDFFSEVHVIVLSIAGRESRGIVRLADNTWGYYTESRSWWRSMYDAYVLANEQLTFGGGFRADLILAEDPFESGVASYFISKKHARPFQIHVLEDFFDPAFKSQDPQNSWRVFMTRFTIPKAGSIRTRTEYLKNRIIDEYPRVKERIEALPMYHNLEVWRELTEAFDLKERYPQFKFIILHVSSMRQKSRTKEVILGASGILRRYPTLGLVILGNGPLRDSLEKLVIEEGVQNQVEFEPIPNEVISHMKSANVLIHLSEDSDEDETMLQAASVKLPMIVGSEGLAGALFKDNVSALVCRTPDPVCIGAKINKYLNENQTRTQIARNAQDVVFTRIEQDYGAYLTAYKESIERGIYSKNE